MEGGSNPRVLSHGSNPISDQLFVQWQNSCEKGNATSINQQEELKNSQPQEQCSPGVELMHVQYGSSAESQQQQVSCSKEPSELLMEQKDDQLHRLAEPVHLQDSLACGTSVSENISSNFSQEDQMQHAENHQYSKLQKMNNQQVAAAEPANNSVNRNKPIQFGQLLPVILTHIDKDRAMQLRTLYSKSKERGLPKSDFVRLVRNLIGDQVLRQAYKELHQQMPPQPTALETQAGTSCPPHGPITSETLPLNRKLLEMVKEIRDNMKTLAEINRERNRILRKWLLSRSSRFMRVDSQSVNGRVRSRHSRQSRN